MSDSFIPERYISWIEHNGKKVLLIDYSHCKDKWQMIEVVKATASFYQSAPGKIFTLSDFNNVTGSQEYMAEVKRLGKELFDAKTERGAVVGITGLKKVFLSGYNLIAKQKIMPFNTKEQALDYLTK
ncbi:MAG: hypothetical protein CMB80_13675 [Flammeovirgaceae bacterium]|nr:hypothetical protein [Flammeovirgaceae bacterium]MBE63449.1 hypothetical protein [Flammeovirgaceae bacterium]MBR06173.1 hypothetical protein [Rickettsiales bacterium]HCX20423.1 hypothetical protein [Cytophagales bacterium]|tara:strand:- start:8985 stop:9365 length:381 start_codon:yes stop_codon:yes gene_type:complete